MEEEDTRIVEVIPAILIAGDPQWREAIQAVIAILEDHGVECWSDDLPF